MFKTNKKDPLSLQPTWQPRLDTTPIKDRLTTKASRFDICLSDLLVLSMPVIAGHASTLAGHADIGFTLGAHPQLPT
jgi:hypothetical protein